MSKPLPRRDLLRLSRPFLEARNARRQHLAKHLNAASARPTLEALIDVANGRDLDETLEDFGRIPVWVFQVLGADTLGIDQPLIIDGGGDDD